MQDLIGYLEKMEKSMADKLFFIDKIDISKFDLIADFGCANGALLHYLNKVFPNCKYIGYDISEEMIKKASINKKENMIFTCDFEKFKNLIQNKKYAIVFSSVLHELNNKCFKIALNLMENSSAVIIRDMFFDKTKNEQIDCSKILKEKNKYIIDFESKYGKIDNLQNLYHYFLKYTYTKNWKSELLENYFGIDYRKIFNTLKLNNFNKIFDEEFTLPYKKQEVMKNFNYDLKLPTHKKLIFIKENCHE